MARLLRILVVAWLLVGLSGATPAMADLLEAQSECCADEAGLDRDAHRDGGDSGAESCPPTCEDCVCRTVSVAIDVGALDAVWCLVQRVDPPRQSSRAIPEPSPSGVFRPPRAHA